MPTDRSLDIQVLTQSLEQIASDLSVVIAALRGVPPVKVNLGRLAGAGGRRIGQVLVGRQCRGDVPVRYPKRPAKPPKGGPA